MPTAVLAHAAHGNALGTPEWVLEAGLVLLAVLTWLALRTSWPRPRLATAADGRLLGSWSAPVLGALAAVAAAVGVVLWAATVAAALFAVDDPTENLAPFVVNLRLVAGGVLLSLVFGAWWRAASPFATLARIVPDRADAPPPPWWVGPALLTSLLWWTVAFHLGGDVRWVGAWLVGYTVVVVAGAAVWGRSWAADGEGIAMLLGAVARIAPVARDGETGRLRVRFPVAGLGRPALAPGTTEACLCAAATAAYGAIHRLDWFQREVMGLRIGWERTLVDTLGLAFAIGVTLVVWRALAGARATDAAPVVPLATGVILAFLFTLLVERAVDVAALLSDPFGRDWDLFGTADWYPDVRWQTSTRLAWLELAALAAATVAAVVVAHDRGLDGAADRAVAERGTLRVVAAITVLATTALVVLLR